jgi:2-oxoglutarate ferredoxin oxidoreductase subunit gamma
LLIKTVFAGFGGQGVLLMGYVLAHSVMLDGKHVTYLPSYGAEMRGGTANCIVSVSDEEIASPVASSPDVGVIMNKPSLDRFQNQLQSGGIIYLNSDLIDFKPVRGDMIFYEVPANTLALKAGNDRAANMVMLGAFLKHTPLVSVDMVCDVIEEVFAEKGMDVVDVNKKAFLTGYKYLGGD